MARKKNTLNPQQRIIEKLRERCIEDLELAILQVKELDDLYILRTFSAEFSYAVNILQEGD